MTGSWADQNPLVSFEPCPRDVCVVTLVDGRRAAVDHATDYHKAHSAASELARRGPAPVKVLPMQAGELAHFLGFEAGDLAAGSHRYQEDRALLLRTCREALHESNEKSVRDDARGLLLALGECP